ncbi:unnamed protein product [Gongylonema pulchrum]|uniref:Intraflagellar transport protein 46 homolog n=1 Tax=Gongylonema pulchrum TaxID=637853 RepID=A0A183DV12_9BILA|nr:unnamed protein product [Gongylonema pulchrum]
MESDEDGSDVYDEIDQHHMTLDMSSDEERQQHARHQKRRPEEVLNVEGDSSEPDGDDDNASSSNGAFSDSDSDNDDDDDNIEKSELAELEEEDAIARQKKLDATLSHLPMEFQDDVVAPEEDTVCNLSELPDISKMTEQEQLQYFLKVNPEFKQILEEYQQKVWFFFVLKSFLGAENSSLIWVCRTDSYRLF